MAALRYMQANVAAVRECKKALKQALEGGADCGSAAGGSSGAATHLTAALAESLAAKVLQYTRVGPWAQLLPPTLGYLPTQPSAEPP